MKLKLFSVALSMVFFMFSCGDDDPVFEPPASEYSTLELSLHGGSEKRWNLKKELLNGKDITSSFKTCELDNVYLYDASNKYSIDAGTEKCTENPEADVNRGYFKMDEEKMELELGLSDTTYFVSIKELTSEKLQWSIEIENGDVIDRTFSTN